MYICLHEWLTFMVNIGTVNIPYMDNMGTWMYQELSKWLVSGL